MAESSMVRCADVQRGYPEIYDRAARIAGGLAALGVGQGDNVALMLRNSVEFVELSVAIGLAGASPVPVNWHWRGDELRHLLTDSGSTVVFAHTEFVPLVRAVVPEAVTVIAVALSPGLAAAVGSPQPGLSAADSVPELEAWLAGQDPVAGQPSGPALGVIYTSGTTGRPKGIVREQIGDEQMLKMAAVMLERMGLAPAGRTLIPAPLYHTAPNTVVTIAVKLGMDITIMPRFDPEQFLAEIERRRVEQVQVVPTMFVRLLRLPDDVRQHYDLSSLQHVVHAAAPCPVPVKRRIIDWLGPIVDEYYGGSETGPIVWIGSQEWLEHPGSVGVPTDGAGVRIIGPDGREVAVGETGEVYVKPADYWPGFTYRGDERKRRDMELDGYVTVGDVGRVDADGYLYLTDRTSDMVISGGVNIYPAEIEAALSGLDGVADCAVFGIPDEEFGEALAAHVELEPGKQLTEDDVREHVRRTLAGYKAPQVVEFTGALPREDSGKLFKRRLRDPYWAAADRSI